MLWVAALIIRKAAMRGFGVENGGVDVEVVDALWEVILCVVICNALIDSVVLPLSRG